MKKREIYAMGFWTVKAGKEADFIQAWHTFNEWTMQNLPGIIIGPRLIQHVTEPRWLISIIIWEDEDAVQEWRNRREFKDFFNQAKELCDAVGPSNWKVAAEVAASLNT